MGKIAIKEFPRMLEVIEDVTGVSVEELKSKSRTQIVVYARIIFTVILYNLEVSTGQISNFLNNDKKYNTQRVRYYLSRFNDEMKYNKTFNGMYNKVKIKL
jgi:chromosomal replication initiation ATPase DnaA